eukprot:gene6713-8033_t
MTSLKRATEPSSAAARLARLRALLLPQLRSRFWQRSLDKSRSKDSRRRPNVTLDRILAANTRERSTTEQPQPPGAATYAGTLFQQLCSQLSADGAAKWNAPVGETLHYFASLDKHDQAWQAVFTGFGAVDLGGPYRDSVAEACSELYSSALPMMVASSDLPTRPLSPAFAGGASDQMLVFLGQLMGMAIRTQLNLNLELPLMTWKALVLDPVVPADLATLDPQASIGIAQMCQLDESEMVEMDENGLWEFTWSTLLSDGTEHSLRPGGASEHLAFHDIPEYCKQVVEARLHESDRQLKKLRDGLAMVVPLSSIAILTAHDLQLLVCGSPEVDVKALKTRVEYEGELTEESECVKLLWQVGVVARCCRQLYHHHYEWSICRELVNLVLVCDDDTFPERWDIRHVTKIG